MLRAPRCRQLGLWLSITSAASLGACDQAEPREDREDVDREDDQRPVDAISIHQSLLRNDAFVWPADGVFPELRVTGHPDDTQMDHWAMLHDGAYRLYHMSHSGTEVYEFSWSLAAMAYQHSGIAYAIDRTGIADADGHGFAMAASGDAKLLYLMSQSSRELIEFELSGRGFVPSGQRLALPLMESSSDLSGWGMTYDGAHHFYAWSDDHQAVDRYTSRDGASLAYDRTLTVKGFPVDGDLAILSRDADAHHLYILSGSKTGTEPQGSLCGDGLIEPGEQCDGADVRGATCSSEGYQFGGDAVTCTPDSCRLDTSACRNFEGDCCEANSSPGCYSSLDPQCPSKVCDPETGMFDPEDPEVVVDDFSRCCETRWDDECARFAKLICGTPVSIPVDDPQGDPPTSLFCVDVELGPADG